MRDELAQQGLQAIDRIREGVRDAIGKPISRASVARAAGLNDATLVRGLSGAVPSRVSTVSAAALGLLVRVIQETNEEVFSVSTAPFNRAVEEAAQAAAFAVRAACEANADGNAKRKLRGRLNALDEALKDSIFDHHRIEKGLSHFAHAWLAGGAGDGVRLALIGAAIAVVNARPLPKQQEAAHAG
jgi:hypothetical protein